MAFRTWGRLLLTALGVSVLAGAGQLGIAYGFGIVRLNGAFTDGSVNRWPAQLVWVAWFAAVAAVAGAVLTERLTRRDEFPAGTTEQLSVAGAAALGATVVAPLCMQPARAAELGGTVDPVWAVGICAVLGAVVGAGAALAVLLNPPLGWNIALTGGALWLLALVSVAPALASTGPLPTARLGVLEPSWLDAATAQRLAMLILPTVALLAGAAAGALARRRGHPALVGGAAGAAGPVLLAFAYLTAGPGQRGRPLPARALLRSADRGRRRSARLDRRHRAASAVGDGGDRRHRADRHPPAPPGRARPGGFSGAAAGRRSGHRRPEPHRSGPRGRRRQHRRPRPPVGCLGHPARRRPAHPRTLGLAGGVERHPDAGTGRRTRPTTGQNARPGDERRPAAAGPAPTDDRDPTTPSAVPADDRDLAPGSAAFADDRDLATPAPVAADDDPGRLADAPASGAVARDRNIGPPARTGATGAGPVIERDADDPTQSLPAPTPLSSARRISAVDLVAAGRTPEAARPGTTPAGTALATPAAPTPTPDRPAQATASPSASGPAPAAPSAQAAAPTPATNGSSAEAATTASAAGTAHVPPAGVRRSRPGRPGTGRHPQRRSGQARRRGVRPHAGG